MLGKILDFICTRLRSTEIALDSLSLVQYDFCRTKTRANKIPYFTKHCRITYNYYYYIQLPIVMAPGHNQSLMCAVLSQLLLEVMMEGHPSYIRNIMSL